MRQNLLPRFKALVYIILIMYPRKSPGVDATKSARSKTASLAHAGHTISAGRGTTTYPLRDSQRGHSAPKLHSASLEAAFRFGATFRSSRVPPAVSHGFRQEIPRGFHEVRPRPDRQPENCRQRDHADATTALKSHDDDEVTPTRRGHADAMTALKSHDNDVVTPTRRGHAELTTPQPRATVHTSMSPKETPKVSHEV